MNFAAFLLLLLVIVAVLALVNPAPSAHVDALPAPIVAAEGSPASR